MAIRKNKKRIDPRYFLHETTYRDEIEEAGSFTTNMPDDIPTTAQVMQQMGDEPGGEEESFSVSGPDPKDALSTHDLFKLMKAGISPDELRGVNNTNLTPEMKSILGHSDAGDPTKRDYRYDDSAHDEGF